MNTLLTTEHLIFEARPENSHGQIQTVIEAAADRRPSVSEPACDTDDRQMRVLIIDDHRATTNTLSSLVVHWGHDVRSACDGATGLALAAAYRPDVLLLDMLMPGVNGFDVAIQVRRQDRLRHCFMIAITGRTDASHRHRCYEAGVDLLLIKPVEPTHLRTLLELELDLVRRSMSRRRLANCRCQLAAAT
jgi:CheY-like chemotaxis protein